MFCARLKSEITQNYYKWIVRLAQIWDIKSMIDLLGFFGPFKTINMQNLFQIAGWMYHGITLTRSAGLSSSANFLPQMLFPPFPVPVTKRRFMKTKQNNKETVQS